ncbi:unnamed protein product [Eruca vesicaria subsp. sativa]|uniref:Uncharacterized protein n=1 Tax=Eruca vesicaria subsp. sativa TaxID=29727 RepID=A0ABC8KGT3_ERUVS|nr:unnamed protein product [Eruca vesicaria subsp. sativa]
MRGRSQPHLEKTIDDVPDTVSLQHSTRHHHGLRHTPADRTKHAFEIMEASKALTAWVDRESLSKTPRRDSPSAPHAPHLSRKRQIKDHTTEPWLMSKSDSSTRHHPCRELKGLPMKP